MAKFDVAQIVEMVRSQLDQRWHHEHEQRLEYLVAEAVVARANAALSDSIKTLTLRFRVSLWDQTWMAWFSGAAAGGFVAWLIAILPFGLFSTLSVLPLSAGAYCMWRLVQSLMKQRDLLLSECDAAEAKLPQSHANASNVHLPAKVVEEGET